MSKQVEVTKVIFRKWPASLGGDIIAIFPYVAVTVGNPYFCESYQHLGQHGPCDPSSLTHRLRLATPEEYADLHAELTRSGYNLEVIKRIPPAALAERKRQLSR